MIKLKEQCRLFVLFSYYKLGDKVSIKIISDLILDIYIKKELICDIDLKNKEELENYLKKLFKILKEKYNIEISGFYDITVYIDKYYGVIFHLENEDLDYYDYFKNQVDMRLVIVDTEFMYKIEDIPMELLNKVKVYIKNNNIYLKIKKELTKIEMMNLMENSKIVYED